MDGADAEDRLAGVAAQGILGRYCFRVIEGDNSVSWKDPDWTVTWLRYT